MSYAERLNGFNQAISSTNDHVKALRDAMNNPEIRDNPIKMALETAGQATGTIGGVAGGVARVRDSAVMRNVQKAFFDKLSAAKKAGAPQSVIDGIQAKLDKALGKAPTGDTAPTAPSSNGAHNADNGNSGGTEAPSDLGPGGTEAGLGPGGTQAGGGAGNLGPGGEAGGGGGASNLGPGGTEAVGTEGTLGGDLPFQVGAQSTFAEADVVAPQVVKSQFSLATEGGSGNLAGLGQQSVDTSRYDNLFPERFGPGGTQAPPSGGASSLGPGGTEAGLGPGGTEQPATVALADNASGGASAGAGSNSNSVARLATPEDNLEATLPFQAGGQRPATGNPSSDAHAVSQQQGSNVETHMNANDPSQQATQTNLDPEAEIQANRSATQTDGVATGNNLDTTANATNSGANVADEAGNGLKTATKVEEGLDELAPDTGPLAPFIEIGSLLATLGTSIASLFEKKDKTTAPTGPKPGSVMSLAVGANLKQGSTGGSVGAF